jgi:thiamine-monophosphate kinase
MTGQDTGSGEDRLIARHFRPLATHPGALSLIDDAAVVRVPQGHELVLKTDAIIAGVHCAVVRRAKYRVPALKPKH